MTCSTADEQRVLARLSVFAGGCSLEAAEAVCSGAGIDEVEVLDLLSALVARSLVVAEDAPSGERRYRLLETIRQYAEERVDDAERAELRDRHADFYVDFAETAAEGLRGPDQLRWVLEIESELENVRAALAWSIATNDAVRAARFLCSVGVGPSPLARMLLRDAEAVLELPGIETIERYPFVLAAAGAAAVFHGMFDRAEQLCQEALDAAGEPNDELAGLAFIVRAIARYGLGDVTGAVRYMERSVSAHRRFGDPFMLAFSLGVLASFRSSDSSSRRGRRRSPRGPCVSPPDRQSRSDQRRTRGPRPHPRRNRARTEPHPDRRKHRDQRRTRRSRRRGERARRGLHRERAARRTRPNSQAHGPRPRPRDLDARHLLRLPRGHRADARPRATRGRGDAARDHRQLFPASRTTNRTGPCANARPKQSTPNSTRHASASYAHRVPP